MDNIKILDVSWFGCIGIVTIDDSGEIKSCINICNGAGSKEDIDFILERGAIVYPEQLQHILSFYSITTK